MGLDTVELVMAFEEAFDIHIEDSDAAKMTTPGHVTEYVSQQVQENDQSIILRRIIEITSAQLGIPIEKINKDSHFVEDLGAD